MLRVLPTQMSTKWSNKTEPLYTYRCVCIFIVVGGLGRKRLANEVRTRTRYDGRLFYKEWWTRGLLSDLLLSWVFFFFACDFCTPFVLAFPPIVLNRGKRKRRTTTEWLKADNLDRRLTPKSTFYPLQPLRAIYRYWHIDSPMLDVPLPRCPSVSIFNSEILSESKTTKKLLKSPTLCACVLTSIKNNFPNSLPIFFLFSFYFFFFFFWYNLQSFGYLSNSLFYYDSIL